MQGRSKPRVAVAVIKPNGRYDYGTVKISPGHPFGTDLPTVDDRFKVEVGYKTDDPAFWLGVAQRVADRCGTESAFLCRSKQEALKYTLSSVPFARCAIGADRIAADRLRVHAAIPGFLSPVVATLDHRGLVTATVLTTTYATFRSGMRFIPSKSMRPVWSRYDDYWKHVKLPCANGGKDHERILPEKLLAMPEDDAIAALTRILLESKPRDGQIQLITAKEATAGLVWKSGNPDTLKQRIRDIVIAIATPKQSGRCKVSLANGATGEKIDISYSPEFHDAMAKMEIPSKRLFEQAIQSVLEETETVGRTWKEFRHVTHDDRALRMRWSDQTEALDIAFDAPTGHEILEAMERLGAWRPDLFPS